MSLCVVYLSIFWFNISSVIAELNWASHCVAANSVNFEVFAVSVVMTLWAKGRVARSLEIFSRTFCFSMRYRELLSWTSTGGEKRAFSPPLGIGTKKQKFLENLKSASSFRLIDLILAITLYLQVWYSHYTRASFTILVWCSDELAIHSWPPLRLQSHVA